MKRPAAFTGHPTDLILTSALEEVSEKLLRKRDKHLAGCPECQRALLDLEFSITALSLSVPLVQPPASLRERVLAIPRQAGGERPSQHRGWAAAWRHQWQSRVVQPLSGLTGQGWAAAGLAVALIVVSAYAVQLRTSQQSSSTSRVAVMEGMSVGQGARAWLIYSPTSNSASLLIAGLPPAADGKTYQLWLITAGRPVNAGAFNVPANGDSVAPVRAALPFSTYGAAGVTIEPAGGSPQPTGPRVLYATF